MEKLEFSFEMFEEVLETTETGAYHTYGISLLRDGAILEQLHDVHLDAQICEEITGLLNQTHTSPINWKDCVIEEINRRARP